MSSRTSLRRRWNRSLALLVVSIAGAMAVGVTVAITLTDAFESTAVTIERHTTALSELRDEIVSTAVLNFATNATSDEVGEARLVLEDRFDDVYDMSPSPQSRASVQRAREVWRSPAPEVVAVGDVSSSSTGRTLAARAQTIFGLLERAGSEGRAAMRERLDEAARTRNLVLATMVLAGLMAVGIALRLARRLSREVLQPIGDLQASTNLLRDGHFEHRATVARVDELGDLAASFNAMADAVMQMKGKLVAQASSDPLTGLPNRHAFNERLAAAGKTENAERPGAVLFIDLDDFKQVNDKLGHAGGDELLRLVALRLGHALRPGDFVARLGGDEFAVLLEPAADPEALAAVAERLVATFQAPMDVLGNQVQIGASVGLAFRHSIGDPDATTREADIAMYAAKGRGKNRLERFDPRIHDHLARGPRLPGPAGGRDRVAELTPGEI